MIYEKKILDYATEASLTRYQLDYSTEMPETFERPAVLVIPGGGFTYCSERETEPVAIAYLNMGYHAYILRYSVGMHGLWPKPFYEAEQAMRIIREHSEEWHTDPNRIAVVGFSAGGHLAAALGTMGQEKPNAMILGYPGVNTDVLQMGFLQDRLHLEGHDYEPYPVIQEQVDKNTPPAFVFFAGQDHVIQYSKMNLFFKRMEENNIPFEMHHFAYGGHGFSTGTSAVSGGAAVLYDPDYRGKWVDLSHEWLKRTWGDFKHDKPYVDCNIEPDCGYTGSEYSLDDSMGTLLGNKECISILKKVFPEIESIPKEKYSESLMYMIRMSQYGNIRDFQTLLNLEKELHVLKKGEEK